MQGEGLLSTILAAEQARAAWLNVWSGWLSVLVNALVVATAVGIPFWLRRLEAAKARRLDHAAVRAGEIALGQIDECAEWIGRASNSESRTVHDFQPTVQRRLLAARLSLETQLKSGIENAAILSFLAETLVVVMEAQEALNDLPRSRVADGVGVPVLTNDRQDRLAQTGRLINDMAEHRDALRYEAEGLHNMLRDGWRSGAP